MRKKLYYISICILCVISVALAIMDFIKGLSHIEKTIDSVIYFLFVFDYFIRLIISEKKGAFIKENIFDLIAIIPFNALFRVFRVLKFTRLWRFAKLTKLFKVGSVSARLLTRSKKFLNTNGFKYVLMLTAVSVIIGAFGMMYFEKETFQNAIWWSFVTATTVGYGDLSPETTGGRIIASILMIIGIGLISSLTSSITSFFLQDESNSKPFSSGSVEILLMIYDSLSDEEKEIVKNEILN